MSGTIKDNIEKKEISFLDFIFFKTSIAPQQTLNQNL